ncbi:xanthine dehydrogenase-like isoform X2 [Macrosteles quadrilineatus]|uniref:xanthine dehydrogenase-like isoform X2 n=1 Tax=Macrosteles quadrilineatus TaxID=74068 RepID=UPI0023E22019|nr:xanthine dehydrogenase-like isoform X2 [Macrosteles quadrilineatus]
MMPAKPRFGEVTLTINKRKFKVCGDLPPSTSLSSFIRSHAHLSGTKTMCEEGGCGSCVVAVRRVHSVTGQDVVYAINSCLVPVLSCHGWDVMTVEGIGSQHSGYHPLQVLLAAHNGSQCGYCSPGMVVNMYSLMENQHKLTQEEIEQSFDGNICRCTGYRPILEAFKSVASNPASGKELKCHDIEDMLKGCINGCNYTIRCDPKNMCKDKSDCLHKNQFDESVNAHRKPHSESLLVKTSVGKWYKVSTKQEVFEVLKSIDKESYRFIAGNTAHGVYRDHKEYQNLIDISDVSELKSYDVSDSKLIVGVNMCLTELILVLRHVADSNANLYQYTATLADHISLIANVPVRNAGTIAGNICIKKQHPEFPSDLFLCLETVGAQIVFERADGKSYTVSLVQFLSVDLDQALLMYLVLPPLDKSLYFVRTFKIMPRAKNVHAYINAGFCFKVDKASQFKLLEKPAIVYGGISSSFVHASATECLLESLSSQGKGLLLEEVLQEAVESLQKEIHPEPLSPEVNPQYRVGLAVALFYKTMLGLSPETVAPQYRSGATILTRPVSSSKRDFDTDKSVWPVNKPIPKVEALYQCSGEAQYVADIPQFPGELHGAVVLTTVGKGTISAVDSSQALQMPGVMAFYTAKDIPGVNSFTTGFPDDEPVLCDGKVLYHGQPVGIIVAKTHKLALKAASKVVVKYCNVETPAIDMKNVIERNDEARIILQAEMTPTAFPEVAGGTERVTVKGSVDLHEQYHMTMELQTCVCVPVEDGMDVYSSTQWMEHVHNAVSRVLSIPAHRINMKVRRLGGGYGAKLTRATWVATLCAVAAKLTNTTVRFTLPLETNMAMMGKRYGCLTNYKVEVDKATGKILSLEGSFFEDAGWSENDPVVEGTMMWLPSAYDSSTWNWKGNIVKTDKASNTWCRSPGSTEAIGTIEVIMDSIATNTGLDPVSVRLANMVPSETNPVPSMVDYWRKHTDYDTRLEEINKYNSENRWKKRGISLVPLTYKLMLASRYNAMVTIYAVDGTVAVSHGGIECGQGINTKVVQVCALGLGIDMSLIQVKPTDILVSPNNEGTGGSVSSESVCYAVMECCKKLLERLEPVRSLLPAGYTWQDLIQKAYSEQVKLNASYLFTSKDNVKDYDIYGVTVAEVEVDILTGQHQVRRVDILEDAGVSLSPEIDIGQVEGAFVMGLGYYTLENLVYSDTGALLTNRTWVLHYLLRRLSWPAKMILVIISTHSNYFTTDIVCSLMLFTVYNVA